MMRSNCVKIFCLSLCLLLTACSLRNLQGMGHAGGGEHQVPAGYAEIMHTLLELQSSRNIEDSLLAAYDVLADEVGAKKAESTVARDLVFHNEFALVVVRKREFARAAEHLEKAWQGMDEKELATGPSPFRTELFALENRLYDRSAMDAFRDQVILSTFRDFYFLEKKTERAYIDRIMRRTHRFPPQPSLFPGSLATLPIEIINDWNYRAHKADLLTWRRFSHLQGDSSSQLRKARQALAINLFIVGVLQGDKQIVERALGRLEQSFHSAGQIVDRQTQGVLMFGYFVLGNDDGVKRHADSALKPLLISRK
jgi:hypothetical protein